MLFITSPSIVSVWVVVVLVIVALASRLPPTRRGIRGAVAAGLLLVGLGEIAFAELGLLLVGFGPVSLRIASGFLVGGIVAAVSGGVLLVTFLRQRPLPSP
jgi:hypothetical protein